MRILILVQGGAWCSRFFHGTVSELDQLHFQPFHTGIVLKSSFEMEFFKFLHCAWVYSFRVVYAVLGYACVTPKKTQKDRDYPLTSGTNPLISFILLTIFFWRQMSCLHYAGVPTTKVRKIQKQIFFCHIFSKKPRKFINDICPSFKNVLNWKKASFWMKWEQ